MARRIPGRVPIVTDFNLQFDERLVALNWVIFDRDHRSAGTYWFAATDAVPAGEEESHLRRTVKTFIKAHWKDTYHPNWGDAVDLIPDNVWREAGFRFLGPTPMPDAHFIVDHDEDLRDR